MSEQRKAVVLLSGGLDSTTVLAIAKQQGFDCHALTFHYGQRHDVEIEAAKRVAKKYGVEKHIVANLDPNMFGRSALTNDIDVPKDRNSDEMLNSVPSTYVPARNLIFLSIAAGIADEINARDIFIGVNAVDYSGYPDCRSEFIHAFQKAAGLGTRIGEELTIRMPLIAMSKGDIVKRGLELGVDYRDTTTCYDPGLNGEACGHCDACTLRLRGFIEAGEVDPIVYLNRPEILG